MSVELVAALKPAVAPDSVCRQRMKQLSEETISLVGVRLVDIQLRWRNNGNHVERMGFSLILKRLKMMLL